MKEKILIVDDIQDVMDGYIETLSDEGITANGFTNPLDAIEWLRSNKVDMILLDYRMPEMTGKEFVEKLREYDEETIVILQTGYAEQLPPIDTMKELNIQGYFDKDKGPEELLLTVLSALKTAKLLEERNVLKYKTGFIGNCLDEVSDQLGDKLFTTNSWISQIEQNNQDEKLKSYIENAQKTIKSGEEVIKAICFNSPRSRKLSEIFDFVKVLNKYKTGKVGMDICCDLRQDINIEYYNNSCLVYLLSETVLYIIEKAKQEVETSGISVKKVIFSAETNDNKVNVIVENEFGYEYEKEFIDKLNLIIADEPEELIEISVSDKRLTIGFNDVEIGFNNAINVGHFQN